MVKGIFVTLAGLLILSGLGMVSALDVPGDDVLVCGDIALASDPSAIIQGATVNVTCISEIGGMNYLTTTSTANGDYCVLFKPGLCEEDAVIYAGLTFKDLSGQGNGIVIQEADGLGAIADILINDVPLVPEFGAIVGMITILGAVGIFFVVRRD